MIKKNSNKDISNKIIRELEEERNYLESNLEYVKDELNYVLSLFHKKYYKVRFKSKNDKNVDIHCERTMLAIHPALATRVLEDKYAFFELISIEKVMV